MGTGIVRRIGCAVWLVCLGLAERAAGGLIFDNATEGWTSKATMPVGLSAMASAMWNGSLYVAGGYSGGQLTNSVLRYDGGTAWTVCPSFPYSHASVSAGLFALGGSLYYVGGASNGMAVAAVHKYDGASWTTAPSLPGARRDFAVAVLNGSAYVIGGCDSGGGMVSTGYRFDGTNWTTAASLPASRYCASAATLGNYLYVMGGLKSGGVQSTEVLRFDGSAWTTLGVAQSRWLYHPAVCVDGWRFLFSGGMNTSYTSITNITAFDGTSWTEQRALGWPLSEAAAGVVNGQLYVAGGGSSFSPSTSTLYYRLGSTGVSPVSGAKTGGFQVTIAGSGLGSGTDITNVTLCGVSVLSINSQSASQVVVTAGACPTGRYGDVRVFSASCGETVKSNAFNYYSALVGWYTTDWGTYIESDCSPTLAAGTDFGAVDAGSNVVHELYVSEDSDRLPLNIDQVELIGPGAAAFSVNGVPSFLEKYGYEKVSIRFAPQARGLYVAAVRLHSDGDPSPFVLKLCGQGLFNADIRGGAGFGVQASKFGFDIVGDTNKVVMVEACTNLAHPVWSSVGTRTLVNGKALFQDANWTNYPARFYRLRAP
jgi:hypothetical protein